MAFLLEIEADTGYLILDEKGWLFYLTSIQHLVSSIS